MSLPTARSHIRSARDAKGEVAFDLSPIERICAASGTDPAGVFGDAPDDNLAALIAEWYRAHRAAGGADAVSEELIAEAALLDAHSGGFSDAPGRA